MNDIIALQELFTKGDDVQKISIIQSLPQLAQIDETATYTRIFPKIQQELPNSSCEFHINASRIFQLFVDKPRAPGCLLMAILQGIESRDPIIVHAWLETLIAIIPTLSDDVIRKEILPVAKTKSALIQPVLSRIVTCSILGKLALHPKFKNIDVKNEILPIALSLSQDTHADVRATMCSQLHFIAKGLGVEFTCQTLLQCLVELGSDNNVNVRAAAIPAAVKMFPYVSPDAKKSTLLPFFKKYIEHISKYEEIIAGAIAKDFGLILDGFSKILSGTDLLIFLNCFKLLARKGISNRTGDAKFGDPQKDVVCRDRCAYNIPAFMTLLLAKLPDQLETIYSIFRDLAADPCYIVRHTIAGCIHEVARLLGPQNKMMKADIVRLLRDDAEEVIAALIPNIGTTMMLLMQQGLLSKEKADQSTNEIGRAMLKCHLELTKGLNFRLLTTYLEQLEKMPLVMPSDFIHQNFTPSVLSNALNGRALPVRAQAISTLLVFLKNNTKDNQQKWIRDVLISELCFSNSFYTRRLYIILCSKAMNIFPDKYFKDYFYVPLLSLADDPVSNIRYSFVGLLPQLKNLVNSFPDNTQKQLLADVMRRLEEQEKNRDVREHVRKINRMMARMGGKKGPVQSAAPVQSGAGFRPAVKSVPSTPSTPPTPAKGVTPPKSASNPPPTPPPKAAADMPFLEQHFYTDAGVSLPSLKQKGGIVKRVKKRDENSTPDHVDTPKGNVTDDEKLMMNSRLVRPKAKNEFNKRHSSILTSSCLENQAKKVSHRRSLNLQGRDFSKIPVLVKSGDERSREPVSTRRPQSGGDLDKKVSCKPSNLPVLSKTPAKK